ncbi:MAG: hypothetical protein U0Z53_21450 [Blastocatellia bacterium]
MSHRKLFSAAGQTGFATHTQMPAKITGDVPLTNQAALFVKWYYAVPASAHQTLMVEPDRPRSNELIRSIFATTLIQQQNESIRYYGGDSGSFQNASTSGQ